MIKATSSSIFLEKKNREKRSERVPYPYGGFDFNLLFFEKRRAFDSR